MTTERTDTTIGVSRDTLAEFKEAKIKFMALAGKEVSDDFFEKKLIKHFITHFKPLLEVAETK